MSKWNTNQIKEFAKKLIKETSGGVRYSQLVEAVLKNAPETPKNTINGSIWNLDTQFPAEITKPARGLFKWINDSGDVAIPSAIARISEENFYESFANWLKNDLDEVVDASPLCGAAMGKKWGTPDVVGVYKPLASQLIKFTP